MLYSVTDVSALELVKSVKPDGSLMKKLMKQRPARVSHLLQENMPKCTSPPRTALSFSY